MSNDFVHVRKGTEATLTAEEDQVVKANHPHLVGYKKVYTIKRAERHGVVFEGANGARQKRHLDTNISYMYDGNHLFGTLQHFLRFELMSGESAYLAVISPYLQGPESTVPFAPPQYFDRVGVTREQVFGHIRSVKCQK